jgi:hypothetical protein
MEPMNDMTWKPAVIVAVMQLCWIGSACAEPSMFWLNDPVGPDDTVLVMGDHLNEIASATVSRIPDLGSQPEQETPVEVMQASPSSLKFVIPKEFAAGVYRFMLAHAQGTLTGRINLPTIYWTQGDLGDTVSPSGWIQLFGRNIVRRPERARLMLLREGASAAANAKLTKGDLWRGSFQVPDGLAPGAYQARLFNGDGGDAEWVDAGTITVRTADPEPAESFDVRAYGAIGNGKVDCTRAVRSAIEAAKDQGGGILYFPRGRYLLSDAIVIPPRVRIQGERMDLVNLVWPDFTSPPAALIQGTSHFSIEDVTIYASNHLHVISGGYVLRDTRSPDAGDIAIRRVRIRASAFRGQMDMETTIQRMRDFHRIFPDGGPDTIRLTGNRIEVSDCDILGSGNSLRLFKVVNAVISGNSLHNGRDGNYSLLGSSRVVFENNLVTAADLQATGGGVTTLSKSVTSSENIYFGNNTFKAIYGWDREGMTSDGPGGYYFGRAESASSQDLLLLDTPSPSPATLDWTGALVMVVNGRGAGQYARVTSFMNTPQRMSITLDRTLQVQLDRSSEITVVPAHANYLIVGNSFEDTGVGAQIFGTGIGHVIAGNRSTRTSGFAAIGLIYGHFQPCWRIQILDNHIIEGNVYRAGPDRDVISNEALIFVRANQIAAGPGKPPLVQAVIVRGNQLDQDAHIQIEGFSAVSPGVRDVVVEANNTGPSRVGMVIDRGVASWLARRNIEGRRIAK